MLAPQLNLLTAYDQRLPYAIIGKSLWTDMWKENSALLSMISAGVTTTLPETKGRGLLQTKREAVEFYEKARKR